MAEQTRVPKLERHLMNESPTFTRRSVLVTGATALLLGTTAANALPRIATSRSNQLAVKGYDTTAYFEHSEPRKGNSAVETQFLGATWRFASRAEAELFLNNPTYYAPQFGGYCTRALSRQRTVPGSPKVWRIYQDKLYLFARPVGGEKFDENRDEMLALAAAYWNTLDLT